MKNLMILTSLAVPLAGGAWLAFGSGPARQAGTENRH